jgi:tripartite-type tricarboxylate transporter receptor subunit TctC
MTSLFRRVFIAALCTLPFAVAAQTYPDKPIRYVVPYPPGGPLDAVARLLGQKVSERLGQPIIVENKPGAGGNIGADFVAKSAHDGYTILMGAVATHAINPGLYAKMPYDPVKDFTPITLIGVTPNVLVVNPAVPAKDVKEFIAYAKANPGKLNFGSGSTGSAGHLAGELFNEMAGVQMAHIPYKGAAPAMQDLIGGQIQLMFDNMASSLPQVKAGKIRALAVTTPKRASAAPELPAIAESGLPGFDISTWFGLFAPANVPKDVVAKLHTEFTRALALPDVKEKLAGLGIEPVGNKPEEFAAYIKSEAAKYGEVIKKSGARVD